MGRTTLTRAPLPRRHLTLAMLAAVLLTLVPASKASAHATLLETVPADGARLESAPASVGLTFSGPVTLPEGAIRVFDASGAQAAGTAPERGTGGKTVTLAVPGLAEGGYVVAWHVVSADSHPIRGAFTFQVGDGPAVGDAAALVESVSGGPGSGPEVGVALGLARLGVFAGLSLLVGAVGFVWLVWPAGAGHRAVERLVWGAWALAALGTVAGIALQGPYVAATGFGDTFSLDNLRTVLGTRFGSIWTLRAALLLAVLPALRQSVGPAGQVPSAPRRMGAALLGLGLLATPGMAGHPSSGDHRLLARLADVSHLAGVALWLGGLVVLVVAVLPRPGPEAEEVLHRFSRLAAVSVAVVVASGAFQGWRQVRATDALTGALTYGRLLIAKLALFATLIGFAAVSRHLVQRRGPAGGPGAAHRAQLDRSAQLRRSVAAEVVAAVGVLAVTAVLVNSVPAREAMAHAGHGGHAGHGKPLLVAVNGEKFSLLVRIDPAAPGRNSLHVTVSGPDGKTPLTIQGLEARLRLLGKQIDLSTLFEASGSTWTAEGIQIPFAGDWEATFTARISGFEADDATGRFTIPGA